MIYVCKPPVGPIQLAEKRRGMRYALFGRNGCDCTWKLHDVYVSELEAKAQTPMVKVWNGKDDLELVPALNKCVVPILGTLNKFKG